MVYIINMMSVFTTSVRKKLDGIDYNEQSQIVTNNQYSNSNKYC